MRELYEIFMQDWSTEAYTMEVSCPFAKSKGFKVITAAVYPLRPKELKLFAEGYYSCIVQINLKPSGKIKYAYTRWDAGSCRWIALMEAKEEQLKEAEERFEEKMIAGMIEILNHGKEEVEP